MKRRILALLMGLALAVVSVTPVAAATATPGWTIWYGDADAYHVEWSATEYTHVSPGPISFNLRNNIDGGMSMGVMFSYDSPNQSSRVGGTQWANGQLGTKPFYYRWCVYLPCTDFGAGKFRIGVKTNIVLNQYNDLSWSGYLYY